MHIRNGNCAVRANREIANLHPGFGFDLKHRAGQQFTVNIRLADFQRGALVILEIHLGIAVSYNGNLLGCGIQQIVLRHALFPNGIYTRSQSIQRNSAICAGRLSGDSSAVGVVQGKSNPCYRLAGILIRFTNGQTGFAVVSDNNFAVLARKQLHMKFLGIFNIVIRHVNFLHRINTRLQIINLDFALRVGNSIKIVAAVLNFGDTESYAA